MQLLSVILVNTCICLPWLIIAAAVALEMMRPDLFEVRQPINGRAKMQRYKEMFNIKD